MIVRSFFSFFFFVNSLYRSLRISPTQPQEHLNEASSTEESSDCESGSCQQKDKDDPSVPVEILPWLYLGNASHSQDLEVLRKYNIQVN